MGDGPPAGPVGPCKAALLASARERLAGQPPSPAVSECGSLLAQLFPGRPPVRRLLETLQEWLASLPLDRIPYNAVLDLVNNKMRVSPAFPGSVVLQLTCVCSTCQGPRRSMWEIGSCPWLWQLTSLGALPHFSPFCLVTLPLLP